MISTNTVPVALNLYVIRVQKDAAGDFFRSVQKQRPAQYQGLYLVSPDGKVLASHQNFKSHKTWAKELLADIEPGLKAFGEVKPRDAKRANPSPFRGLGIRPDGGATLAVYLRYSYKRIPLNELPNPTIDSLPLSVAELAQLGPPKAEVGTVWELPDALARQFCRVLGPGDEDSMPRPNEVTAAKLTANVREVENGIAVLDYEGSMTGSHLTQAKKRTHGEVKMTGSARYDAKAGRLLSLVWVFDGIYKAPPPYDQPRTTGGVVEWQREQPKK